MILDQGEKAGKYRWCVVMFDANENQIGELQGYDWQENPKSAKLGGKSIYLERPKPSLMSSLRRV